MALFLPLYIYKLIFLLELSVAEIVFAFRFKKRSYFYLRLTAAIVISFVAVFFFPSIYGEAGVSLIFFAVFLLTVAALFFLFDTKLVNVIFVGLCAYCIQHCVYQVFNILLVVFGMMTGPVNAYGSEMTDFAALGYAPLYVMTYALVLWLVGVVAFVGCKDWKEFQLRSPQLLILAGLFLATNVIVNAFVSQSLSENWSKAIVVCTSLTGIVSCVLTLWVLFSLVEQKALKVELGNIYHLYRQEQKQLASSKTNIELINRKCHDLKHQIRNIGRTRIINEQAIEEIEGVISIYDSTVKTGNKTLDVILTEKSLLCRDNDINFTCVIDGAKLDFMSEVDIYSLFGNALDNAIEAVLKLDKKERAITLTSSSNGNMFLVSIRNFYDGKMTKDEGGLKTSKSDDGYHGFGLLSIKATVAKYDGVSEIVFDDDTFTLKLLFSVPDRKEKFNTPQKSDGKLTESVS